MPKTKMQDVIFTTIMATFMVYGMIVYNIVLATGNLDGMLASGEIRHSASIRNRHFSSIDNSQRINGFFI